jgi:guanine nucleotide-binding protein subunit alpha
LAACRGDIVALWSDPVVKGVLAKHRVRLEETPGFFLNDAARITSVDYVPSDSDIVRARVRTVGVEEHKFFLNDGVNPSAEWYLYDVGGSRSIRPQWIPFFDDVNSIIFLAPLAYNQVLDEDRKVNRLEDSIHLWREVCANQLLAKAIIILFLNKMDILRQNLAAGIQVVKYVPSYGSAPNDVEHVVTYFRDKFRSYHRRLSPVKRPFICYETSAIDTHATSIMLLGVREGILRAHLQKSNVL